MNQNRQIKKKQTEAPIDVLGNKRNKYREDSYL